MDATSFKLGDQQFLVIPTILNAHKGGSTPSYIYRFAEGSLHKYQALTSQHHYSSASASFEVAGNVYLAIGHYQHDSSTIYQLQGHRFVHFQHVSTNKFVTDIEHLHMDGHDYLVFACYYSSQSLLVFLWNNGNFELYETKQIKGFRDVEHFEIGGEHYLAAARYKSGSSGNVDSYIYKWTGVHFALFQTIPTKGALKFSFTRIGKMLFLAVANMVDSDKPADQQFKTLSAVYKWNGKKFEDFRYLNTTAAASVSFVNMRHHSYLVVGSILANGISVYRAEGSGFHLYQRIPNVNATHTEFIQSNNRTYMFAAGGLFGNRHVSSVYGWMES